MAKKYRRVAYDSNPLLPRGDKDPALKIREMIEKEGVVTPFWSGDCKKATDKARAKKANSGINQNITANSYLVEILLKRLAKAKANNAKNPAINRLRRKVVGVFGTTKSSKRTA